MKTKRSQEDRILRHLERGRGLTALQALEKFGCMRLSARILDLRRAGYNIHSNFSRVGDKIVARYSLAK
jgi:lysozyme family protein